jgi:hypothetical protein
LLFDEKKHKNQPERLRDLLMDEEATMNAGGTTS